VAFSFDRDTLFLPEIAENDSVAFSFTFTNVGTAPILIESVESCHCTEVNYPTTAVAPGAQGTIAAVFYGDGMRGDNKKAILLWTVGSTEPYRLRFAVSVKKAKRK